MQSGSAPEPSGPLLEQEMAVLREIHAGRSDGEVALTLAISENTVRNHIRNVIHKLQSRLAR